MDTGAAILAEGHLSDVIRRIYTFGLTLLKVDLRQESERHSEAIDTITTYLGFGSYLEWDEDAKIDFLVRELKGRRPLIPSSIEVNDNVKEVLETFRMSAELGSHHLGAYGLSKRFFKLKF